MWATYLVRSQLLLLYICAMFATGLAPLVRIIERQSFLRIGKRRLPRPAAILIIYATVIGLLAALAAAITPPLVAQAQQLRKELPERLDQLQQTLVRWGLLSPDASFKELLQNAPAGGGDAVTTVLTALWGIVGGVFGAVTVLLLTFYLLVDAQGERDELRLIDSQQPFLHTLHVLRQARAGSGTVGKDEIGHPDLTLKLRTCKCLPHLVGEFKRRDRAQFRQNTSAPAMK